MAAIKNPELKRLFKERGVTINSLAEQIGAGRCHLSMLINGLGMEEKPGRGRHTKPKLFKVLTPAEIAALGWTAEYQAWQTQQTQKNGN